MLSKEEKEIFEKHRTDAKKDMRLCQRVRMKHDNLWQYNCMCNKITRKVLRKDLDSWYEKVRN